MSTDVEFINDLIAKTGKCEVEETDNDAEVLLSSKDGSIKKIVSVQDLKDFKSSFENFIKVNICGKAMHLLSQSAIDHTDSLREKINLGNEEYKVLLNLLLMNLIDAHIFSDIFSYPKGLDEEIDVKFEGKELEVKIVNEGDFYEELPSSPTVN